MKKYFFSTFCLLLPFLGISQVVGNIQISKPGGIILGLDTLDTSILRVSYTLTYVKDSLSPNTTSTDKLYLDIGKKGVAKFYSENTRLADSATDARIKQLSSGQVDFSQMAAQRRSERASGVSTPIRGELKIIYKNWPTNKLSATDQLFRDTYICEESLEEAKIPWQILADTLTYLSYPCQKAVAEYRGRSYEAWFTSEIPINEGPWKFGGLPGLILMVQDTRHHYVYKCDGIMQLEVPIIFAKKDYLKISRKDLNRMWQKYVSDPEGFAKSSVGGIVVFAGSNTNPMNRNPIELQ